MNEIEASRLNDFKKTLTCHSERERSLKQINISLDQFDQIVNDGILSRNELTTIILYRHILAMKKVLRYAEKNLNCSISWQHKDASSKTESYPKA